MHIKKKQRWLVPASLSVIFAVLFGGLVTQSVRAVGSNPTPICVGAICTVTFNSTGDYYLWTPPSDARNITFDLMGGQGGRTGGKGGRVTGALTSIPTALYIYVGGAGAQGSGVVGGFNGGGNAGTGRGDEGSGGGATDLRTTTLLADRISVAAGGGGSGGFGGGSGGSAGGVNGNAGTSGQGQGGSGATQTTGGSGGYPNGGTYGIAGTLGQGGSGGSSTTSGGGGGGGGYYGGGGGGADIDSCCSNAGGGGGGSSWSSTVQTSSVVHTSGYRAGAGMAIITYSLMPTVTTFTPVSTLISGTSSSYNLVFSESVTGLASSDILMTGSTAICTTVTVTGTGATYTVTVADCGVGTLRLTLMANSITGYLVGPAFDKTATDVLIERTTPTVAIFSPSSPSNAAMLLYTLVFSEPVTDLAVSDLGVTGESCTLGQLTGSLANYTVQVTNCADVSQVQLSMQVNSVADLAANLGPTSAPLIGEVLIDRAAPTGAWLESAVTSQVNPVFEITFAEAVIGVAADDFLVIGTATGCVLSLTELVTGTKFAISTSGCSNGSVQIQMAINAYADHLGNTGPSSVSSSSVTTKIAPPIPTPTPTTISTPTPTTISTPTPTPTPTQVAQHPVVHVPVSSPPIDPPSPTSTLVDLAKPLVIPVESERVTAIPTRKTYAFGDVENEQIDFTSESVPNYLVDEPQITVDNPTDAKPITNQISWQLYASLALGALSIVLAGFGIAKAAIQVRTRRLVRKFA